MWQYRLTHLQPILPYGKEYEDGHNGLYVEEEDANRFMAPLLKIWDEAQTWEQYEEARQRHIHDFSSWDTRDPSQPRLLHGYRSIPAGALQQMEAYDTAVRGQDLPDASWRDQYGHWAPPADRLLYVKHWQEAASFLEYADIRGAMAAHVRDSAPQAQMEQDTSEENF